MREVRLLLLVQALHFSQAFREGNKIQKRRRREHEIETPLERGQKGTTLFNV